jgi:hypothetical protein
VTRGPDAAAEYGTVHESLADDEGFREIADIGDEAFANPFDLHVLAGDAVMKITVYGEDGADIEAAIELGRELVARL